MQAGKSLARNYRDRVDEQLKCSRQAHLSRQDQSTDKAY